MVGPALLLDYRDGRRHFQKLAASPRDSGRSKSRATRLATCLSLAPIINAGDAWKISGGHFTKVGGTFVEPRWTFNKGRAELLPSHGGHFVSAWAKFQGDQFFRLAVPGTRSGCGTPLGLLYGDTISFGMIIMGFQNDHFHF